MQHNIVLIDDNFAIRQIIEVFFARLEKKYLVDINVFSADNGVEGLGYVYIMTPQIVIVDTTLPKYSGREVLDFFIQNPKFHGQDTRVIVLHELSTIEVNLPPDFYLIRKDQSQSFHQLSELLIELLKISDYSKTKALFNKLANFVFHNSNEDDLLLRRLEGKPLLSRLLLRIKWIWLEFTSSVTLTLLLLIFGKPNDNNVTPKGNKEETFRFKHYPILIISIFSFAIIAINFSLFFLGRIDTDNPTGGNIILEGNYTPSSESITNHPTFRSIASSITQTINSTKEPGSSSTSLFDTVTRAGENIQFLNNRLRYFLSMQFIPNNTKIFSPTNLNLFLFFITIIVVSLLSKNRRFFLWKKDYESVNSFELGLIILATGFTYGAFVITDTLTLINYIIFTLYLLIIVLAGVFYLIKD